MIRDMAYFTVITFATGVAFFVIYMGLAEMNTAWQAVPDVPAEGKTMIGDFTTRAPTLFDWFLITVTIGTMLVVLGLIWFLDINPVFFFVLVIIAVVLALVAAFLGNAWETLADDTNLSATISNFTITDFLLTHYAVIIGVFVFLAIMVFIMKPGGPGQ